MDALSVLHRKSRALLSLVAAMALIVVPASTASAQAVPAWARVDALSVQAFSDGSRANALSALSAQTTTDWERVDALPDGARVRITRASGERHNYLFRRATADALVVTRATGTGADEILPKSDVTKVVRQGVRDSSADGTAVGALAGFGIGVGLLASRTQMPATPAIRRPSGPSAVLPAPSAPAAVRWWDT